MSGEDHHWRRIHSFFVLAEEEANAAALLISPNPRQAAFFQQQAVEKMIRALIELERVAAGPTHSLGALADLLGPEHPMRERLKNFDEISSAAAKFRYPTGRGSVPTVDRDTLLQRQSAITVLMSDVRDFVGPLQTGERNKDA